jgi:hypothetical protein
MVWLSIHNRTTTTMTTISTVTNTPKRPTINVGGTEDAVIVRYDGGSDDPNESFS